MITPASLRSFFGIAATEADFEQLYYRELPRVYNYFRCRVGAGPLAEDLTSETFEKAWRHRDRYRRDLAAFSTWLFAIARHVARDYYRRRKPDLPYDEITRLPSPDVPEDAAQKAADFGRLSVLLAQLEERDRELVALKYGAGLTNRAIARLTGLTESNVGVILHRTLHALRSKWENDDEQ